MPVPITSILLPQAFAPARITQPLNPQKLFEIFHQQAPYYAEDAPGTSAEANGLAEEKPTFTAADLAKINLYGAQLGDLYQTLLTLVPTYNFTITHLANLSLFIERMQSRTYFTGQSSLFYSEIKKQLELIVLALLDDDPVAIKENTPVVHDLLDEIDHCGPGVFSHTKKAQHLLLNQNCIETWLADLRETIINQLAGAHVISKKITENDSIHVYNVYFTYACQQAWQPLGFEVDIALNEIHKNLARVNDQDLQNFKDEFLSKYNPYSIVTTISQRLHHAFLSKIVAGNQSCPTGLSFLDLAEFVDFFIELPLVKQKGIFAVLFQAGAIDAGGRTREPDTTFTFAGMTYYLKTLVELKLSLTRFLLGPYHERLFQGFHENIDDNTSYGIVPGCPDLCYIYDAEADNISSLASIKPPMAVDIFRMNQIPLYQVAVTTYIESGQKNFNDCILHDIDLTPYVIDDTFHFSKAIMRNVKITAPQFLTLAKRNINKRQSSFTLDEAAQPTLQSCMALPVYQNYFRENKNHIYNLFSFVAYTLDTYDFVIHLIHGGAALDKKDSTDLTPVQAARSRGHWQFIRAAATTIGILPNDVDQYQLGDILTHSLQRNDTPLALDLLNAAANATGCWRTPPSQNSALHWAAEHNNLLILPFLIGAGADPAAQNSDYFTPMQIASTRGHWDFVRQMAMLAPETAVADYHYTYAAVQAAQHNQLAALTALIEAGAEVNGYTSGNKYYVLHWAVANNNPAMINLLMSAKASLRNTNREQQTPLQLAWHNKYLDCVLAFTAIIDPATNIDDQYGVGMVLLHAVRANEERIALALLTLRPHLNEFTLDDLNSTLHSAVRNDNARLVIALLIAGANTKQVNFDTLYPQDYALSLNHQRCAELIDEAIKVRALFDLIAANNAESLLEAQRLLQSGLKCYFLHDQQRIHWNFKTASHGDTFLHIAARFNQIELTKALIAAGADPGALNNNHLTPLQIAVDLNFFSLVEVYASAVVDTQGHFRFAYGAHHMYLAKQYALTDWLTTTVSINSPDTATGNTLLHLSCLQNRPQDFANFLRLGADPALTNAEGYTPAQILGIKQNWPALCALVAMLNIADNVNDKYRLGAALGHAVTHKATEAGLILLQAQADPNTFLFGYSCLHWAVIKRNFILTKALIFAGANPEAQTATRLTALQLAESSDKDSKRRNRFRLLYRHESIRDLMVVAMAQHLLNHHAPVNRAIL